MSSIVFPTQPCITMPQVRDIWNGYLEAAISHGVGTTLPDFGGLRLPGMIRQGAGDKLFLVGEAGEAEYEFSFITALDLDGGVLKENLDNGFNRITDLASPTTVSQAANLSYLRSKTGFEFGSYVGNGIGSRFIAFSQFTTTTPRRLIISRADANALIAERYDTGNWDNLYTRFWNGSDDLTQGIQDITVGGFFVGTNSAVNFDGGLFDYLAIL